MEPEELIDARQHYAQASQTLDDRVRELGWAKRKLTDAEAAWAEANVAHDHAVKEVENAFLRLSDLRKSDK